MSNALTGRAVMSPKEQVENCNCIDMAQLKREGALEELDRLRKSGNTIIRATYNINYRTQKGGFEGTDSFNLTSTPCYFGGERFWFLCPGCYRRVRILYLPPFRTLFRCRDCHNLTYRARQDHRQRLEPLSRCLANLQRLDRLKKSAGQKGLSKHQKRRLDKLLRVQDMYTLQFERLKYV